MLSRSNTIVSSSSSSRALLLASVAALVVTSFDAHAAPAARPSIATARQSEAASGAEFGARMRGRRGNNAAGLAMMGLMVGAIGGVIAAQQRREAYEAAYARPVYGAPYGHSQSYAYHQPHAYQQQPGVYHQPYAGQKRYGYVFTNGVMHWEGQPLNVPAPPAVQ